MSKIIGHGNNAVGYIKFVRVSFEFEQVKAHPPMHF